MLAYYYDHKEAIDVEIESRHERITELRAVRAESPGRRKLRERGLLPRVLKLYMDHHVDTAIIEVTSPARG